MKDPQPLFAALADPTRRRLFERLSSQGPSSASRLARDLPISRQAVAKHLAALDEAGLVERKAVGREVHFAARLDALDDVTAWAERVGADWETRLARLRRTLD